MARTDFVRPSNDLEVQMHTDLMKVIKSFSMGLVVSLCMTCSTLAVTQTIGGTVTGLSAGDSLTLLDDGTDALAVTANGKFTFQTPLAAGASYDVTIATQPANENCKVSHGSGRVISANVSTVAVSCVPTHTVGGSVSGLGSGDSATLLDNGTDPLTVTANGKFTFKMPLLSGATYKVTVGTEPTGEKCTVRGGAGKVGTANVATIVVSCATAPTFTIGGTVSGLRLNDSVTLLDNGTDALAATADGKFTFKTALDSGVSYKVTVGTQPATAICKIARGSGIVRTASITTVFVTCVPTFSIGGTVTALKAGDSVTLLDNHTDAITISANGKFTFPTRLTSGAAYRVTVRTEPTGEKCAVAHGTGKVTGDVINVTVSCKTAPTFTIGGNVTGLKTGDSLALLDNGADALTVTANDRFAFKTPLDGGARYDVTVGAQPAGEDCKITHGTGVVGGIDVTTVAVACSTAGTHTIGGTASGLRTGDSVTLLDNGTDALKVTADGRFVFETPVATGASYNVTVGTQPAGEICTVTGGTGKVPRANVTNVTVLCTAAPSFTIGGTLSGLPPGALVSLFDNGTDQLNLTTNGAFTFRKGLLASATYNVTIATQPAGETCSVANGTGTVGTSNVTTVSVSCKANPTFTIGGSVSGLNSGTSVSLLDNGSDSLTVSANGPFTFKTALATGVSYGVTVGTQPTGETCTVTGGTGTVATSNVTTVAVSCRANPTFTVGGTVSGLITGASVVLLDNGSDSLTVGTNGTFTFKTALASGAAYKVTISTQPNGETCTVSNGTGTVASANVTNVAVSCTTNAFTIGGTVSGLSSVASVTLLDNGADSLTVSVSGTFTFKTALAGGASYNVTVGTQPTGETCTVTSGTGTVASANVTNVAVSCATNTFTVGGTVSGLNSGASVTLLDNSADSLTVTANGAFAFKTALATGATYKVIVGAQPTSETCTVTNGTGTVTTANVTNVAISCTTNTFTIGGTVSGLSSGASVILLDNGADSLTVGTNGALTFKTALATGATYNVTVATQPADETCTIANGTGTVASANVTNVAVSCATNIFTIGGTVSGLNTGASVALLDNGSDSLAVSVNGTFIFKTGLATGATYSVTVGTQPTGETCTVTNASGTVASSNVTNVSVSCSSSTGGSGTFWSPYTALPSGTTGGSTGLFLMPSDNLESSPAPLFVTTAKPQFLGMAFQFATSPSIVATPALMIYAAAGADGNTHVYGLKVGDTSTVPTATQLSSLSLAPTQQICGFSQAQADLADPTTVFTILDVSPGLCGVGGDVFEVVHYKDSPTTTPTVVAINTTLIYTLYQDGKLVGLILYDANAQSLNLYADGTFTSPKQLATGSSSLGLRLATLTDGTTFGGTVAYINLTNSSGPALYRIDSSSLTLSQVHQGVIGLVAVPDRNNLYFTDVTSASTTVFYQVPLIGGTPMAIYSAPYISGLSSYLLLGTDTSVLAFQFLNAVGSPFGTTTNFFYTIPIGVASTTATTLGGPYVGNVTAFVASPRLGDSSGTVIFVDIINKLAGQQTSYSSVALPLSGTSTNSTPLANSAYPPLGPTTIVQVTDIADVSGGQGGGTLSNIDLSTLQGTVLTTTGGQPYVIPTGYVPSLAALGSNFAAGELSPFLGISAPSIGFAVDLAKNFILPINLPNTNVTIF
jgi:predicted SpoU family rRNA methylase